ncbi:MAG: hypothetical protein ABI042_08770, partial [Verrucomicrobiota bacterium]
SRSVSRSQTWNYSIPVAEAGIEEAIVHLNRNCLWSDITRVPPKWTADSWTAVSNGYYMERTIGTDHYSVTIVTAAPYSETRPAIFSEGDVPALFVDRSSDTLFAAIGAPGLTYVGRKVRVRTRSDGILTKAMVAKQSIDLSGNNVSTDSFDSQDPSYSTRGQYDPNPLKTKDNGDVAVNLGVVDTLSIGNANISGSVATGPGGSISIGSNGKVGDKAWMADASKTGIQPGRSRDDMNVSFPDVKDPFPNGGYSTSAPGEKVTNQVITAASVTNVSTSYPTGSGTVYTNTVTTTSTTYPASGSYLGSVNTNTSYTTTSALPAAGTYIGIVRTNTAATTSTNVPTSGSYIGTTGTNITTVTSNTYPASGSYIGSVTTNTVVTTTANTVYPAAGTYVGTVVTNTQGNGNNANSIISYTYNRIVSYTYRIISGYSFEQIIGYSYNLRTGYTYAAITGYSLISTAYTTNAVTSTTYDYVLDSGNYKLFEIGKKVLVKGNAILYVTDNVQFTGQDSILILPGASLKIYVGASTSRLGGNGVINNGGNATNFYYFGLPSNTDVDFGGNASFTGVVYAPQADFHLGGGGANTYDFVGASVSKTVHMNGHFNFHYDEALARVGPSRGYVIDSWNEIKLSENN